MEAKISENPSIYTIFEAGLNHNGDPSIAELLVREAAAAGADAVKFQKRDIPSLATSEMLESTENRFPSLGNTYREVRSKLELSREVYRDLLDLSKELGIDFMVTPFDTASLEFLLDVGVRHFKIASHSVANPRFLKRMSQLDLPVVCSSGMVTQGELDLAIEILSPLGEKLSLLHCTSAYPTLDEDANLLRIPYLRKRYGLRTGYSGHELGKLHTLAAVALGARVVERHVTVDKSLEGFDHQMSMSTSEFCDLVQDIRRLEVILSPVRTEPSPTEQVTRDKYRVSMVAADDLLPGAELLEGHVTYKNPGTGIPASREHEFLGKRLRRFVPVNTLLQEDDFEQ